MKAGGAVFSILAGSNTMSRVTGQDALSSSDHPSGSGIKGLMGSTVRER